MSNLCNGKRNVDGVKVAIALPLKRSNRVNGRAGISFEQRTISLC